MNSIRLLVKHMFWYKTTGFIDMLMTPQVGVSIIQAYTSTPILELPEAKKALKAVDVILEWSHNYESDEPVEMLKYAFDHHKTKQSIKGINAVTGELILMEF